MIKQLRNGIKSLVADELERARKDNGSGFNSQHEAIAVTWEEVEEGREELERLAECLTDANRARSLIEGEISRIWYNDIRVNFKADNVLLRHVEEVAIDAAAEYIQVAAMARKWREMDRAIPVHKLP